MKVQTWKKAHQCIDQDSIDVFVLPGILRFEEGNSLTANSEILTICLFYLSTIDRYEQNEIVK